MTLDEIRAEIDSIDIAMKQLFVKRMECARHVAQVKAASGGEVFVPERERTMIEQRSADIDTGIREEYVTFLRHLMSVCRRYEYGFLEEMQEQILTNALEAAALSADTRHSKAEIEFCLDYEASDLNLFINMAKLNQVGICGMHLELKGKKQKITMTLDGNVKDDGMKRLLCQIGKEAEGFRILRLI